MWKLLFLNSRLFWQLLELLTTANYLLNFTCARIKILLTRWRTIMINNGNKTLFVTIKFFWPCNRWRECVLCQVARRGAISVDRRRRRRKRSSRRVELICSRRFLTRDFASRIYIVIVEGDYKCLSSAD